MKHMSAIFFILGVACGASCGYYYGVKKERKKCEEDIKSVVDEFEKKLDETRKKLLDYKGESDEQIELKNNGDVDDQAIKLIPKSEFMNEPDYNEEDITYYSKEEVFYNVDLEKTYNQDSKDNAFDFPSDLFSYFGIGDGKHECVYLIDRERKVYYCLTWSDDSYVSDILGYDKEV